MSVGLPVGKRIRIRSLYGFEPERDGYIGWTQESARDTFLSKIDDGDLIMIYGASTAETEMAMRSYVLGFLEVEATPIRDYDKSSELGLERKRKAGWGDRWTYGIPVRRAWRATDRMMIGRIAFNSYNSDAGLATLEDDADGIWGKRAKASRTYTAAERNLEASLRTVRDASLKPKAWSDARAASEEASAALKKLEGERLALKQELRSLDRLRGVASLVEARARTLQELGELADVIVIGEQIEAQARECLDALERAERDRTTAKRLLSEAEERIGAVDLDDAVLDASEQIERLLERRGAETKAAEDLPRLAAKREQLKLQVSNLHKEFGSAIAVIPTRTQVTELRQVLNNIVSARAAADQAESELGDVRSRLARLEQRLTELPADAALTTLISAVDAARQGSINVYTIGSN